MSEHSGKVGSGPAGGGPDKQWALGRDGLETGGPQHSPRRRQRKASGLRAQFGYAAALQRHASAELLLALGPLLTVPTETALLLDALVPCSPEAMGVQRPNDMSAVVTQLILVDPECEPKPSTLHKIEPTFPGV